MNYRRFFLVFCLADAVVDLVEEGASGETNWVPTGPGRRFELMFRLYAPTKALALCLRQNEHWQAPSVWSLGSLSLINWTRMPRNGIGLDRSLHSASLTMLLVRGRSGSPFEPIGAGRRLTRVDWMIEVVVIA